jgi:ribose transport system substrate-binding protein
MNARFLRGTLFTLLAFFSACNPKTDSSTPTPAPASASKAQTAAKGTIGLSVLTMTNPFFKEIADSMTAEARRHGYDVLAVSGEFDVAKQQNQVKDFIVKKVAAIVLTPCDSKSIGPAIQEANDAGIPVFTADIACLAQGPKVVSHIATDNYAGGKEAAKAIIEALGESGGKIALLDHKVTESCLMRIQGFKEVLSQHNTGRTRGRVDIVAELPSGGVKDQGYKAAEDVLQAHADLAGIFAINDPSALGARAALEKAGKTDQVKLVGFDGQPEGKQAIKEGKIYADPIQFPDRIGVETVRAIVKHFSGESVPPQILIPTALYRQADAKKDPTLK